MKNTAKIINFRKMCYLYYSQNGKVLRIPTGILYKDLKEHQNSIDKMLHHLNKIVLDYWDIEKHYPDVKYVKERLNIISNKSDSINSLYQLFIDYKRKKIKKKNSIITLEYPGNLLQKFNEIKAVDVNQLDEKFIESFSSFLINKGICDNTHKVILSKIKSFLEYCYKENLIKKYYIDWKSFVDNLRTYKSDEETFSIDELLFLISKRDKVDPMYNKVLDVLLCQSFTGLRIEDTKNLNKTNIKGNKIVLITKKTGAEVIIGINEVVEKILIENDYNLWIEKDDYNKKIKKLLLNFIYEKPSFGEKRTVRKFIGGKEIVSEEFRFNRFSSHSGRRTFITNAISLNQPLNVIMLNTGHKTLEILSGYINKKQDTETNIGELMLKGR